LHARDPVFFDESAFRFARRNFFIGDTKMNTPDISPLVRGTLVIIGLAIALGLYPSLAHWARAQAVQAMQWHEELAYFFQASTKMRHYVTVKHPIHKGDHS
jgi:hypothetical protein